MDTGSIYFYTDNTFFISPLFYRKLKKTMTPQKSQANLLTIKQRSYRFAAWLRHYYLDKLLYKSIRADLVSIFIKELAV
jgi:hypothetical protein